MKQLFNIRSPFWICVYTGIFFAVVALMALPEGDARKTTAMLAALALAGSVSLLYLIVMSRYNRRNPKHPVRYLGLIPSELKEEDEGMSMFTSRATRRVYIYYSYALPVFALGYVLVTPSTLAVVGCTALLMLGQVVIYWVSMCSVYKDSD